MVRKLRPMAVPLQIYLFLPISVSQCRVMLDPLLVHAAGELLFKIAKGKTE